MASYSATSEPTRNRGVSMLSAGRGLLYTAKSAQRVAFHSKFGSSGLSTVIEGSATANSKDLLRSRLINAREKFRKHPTDCGSMSVQIATMTEKIKNLSRHSVLHKKDKASIRGFQMLVNKRRKLMKYLKRTDLEEFKTVTTTLGITKEAASVRV